MRKLASLGAAGVNVYSPGANYPSKGNYDSSNVVNISYEIILSTTFMKANFLKI